MSTDHGLINLNGSALVPIERGNPERDAYDVEIIERCGAFADYIPNTRSTWGDRERLEVVHGYIENGAHPWIVSRCVRFVGEKFSLAGAARVRELVIGATSDYDLGMVYMILSAFVRSGFTAIAEKQAAERVLVASRRTADIRDRDGNVIRTISIDGAAPQAHRNGKPA
jgi:hypothetical protein